MDNFITVISDASFHSKDRTASWAGWVKVGRNDSYFVGKKFETGNIICPDDAKTKSLVNTVHCALSYDEIPKNAHLVLKTDNFTTIQLFMNSPMVKLKVEKNGRKRSGSPFQESLQPLLNVCDRRKEILDKFEEIVDPHGFRSISIRHVISHKKRKKTGTHKIHNRCDYIARCLREEQRIHFNLRNL